jgi:tetratricopeptide (TPR) repeat protein
LLIDTDNSRAWYLLGRVYKVQNNIDMAYGAYQKAAQADTTNVPAHFDLGMMYVQDGRYQQAIPCFEQVRTCTAEKAGKDGHEGFSYHRAALNMLLFCYQETGDAAKAQMTREEIQVFYPDYLKSDNALAPTDANQGQ